MLDPASGPVAAVLLAAVVHAFWNALLARGTDQIATVRLLVVAQMLMGGVLLLLAKSSVNEIVSRSWQWLIASGFGNVVYWYGLAQSYRNREFAAVYGVTRASIPLFVTLGAFVFADQRPTLLGCAAITIVAVGACILRFSRIPASAAPAFVWGVTTAFGAAVSLGGDSLGVLQADDRLGFFGCSLLTGGTLALGAFRLAQLEYARLSWREFGNGALAGSLAALVYGIGVWAATYDDLGKISALRETSILFAVLIGWLFLKEELSAKRILGSIVLAGGAVTLALGR